MPEIQIRVRDKVAEQTDTTVYVCGSGDYQVRFDFDGEWDDKGPKTARFQTENLYQDVLFYEDTCPVPVIVNGRKLEVGVFAENIRTTTPARVALRAGIRSQWGLPEDPAPSLYDQLAEAIADTGLRLEELSDGVLLTLHFRGGESRAFLRHSEVYVGAGEMPEGYRVQLDVTQTPPVLRVRGLDGQMFPISAIQGEKGEKGDKGDRGEPGPQGPKGELGEHVIRSINGLIPDDAGDLKLEPSQLGAVSRKGDTMQGELNLGGFALTGLAEPQNTGDGATKGYVDSRRVVLQTVIPANWSGTGPYTQDIALPELKETDTPYIAGILDADLSTAIAQRDALACIGQAQAMDGILRLTCLEEAPSREIPIQLVLNR